MSDVLSAARGNSGAALPLNERVRQVVLRILDVDEQDVRPSAAFLTDLGASSIDFVEILAALENEFSLRISDEDAARLRTVQAAVDYVAARTRVTEEL